MSIRPMLAAGALLLATASQAASPTTQGRIHGVFGGHAIDVPAVCEWPRLAGQTGHWFYAQSDPPTHEYAQDRNGDGIAVTASFSGEQAMFLLFIDGQDYNFGNTKKEQLAITPGGFVLTMATTRYEGKGKARRKVGDQEIRLAVDCPRP